jgi:hypothetical protein
MPSLRRLYAKVTSRSSKSEAGETSKQSQEPTIVTTFFPAQHESVPRAAWETVVNYSPNDNRDTDAKAAFTSQAEMAVAETMAELAKDYDEHSVCPKHLESMIDHYKTSMAQRLPATEASIKPVYLEYVRANAVECMCPEHIGNETTLGNSKLVAVTQRYGQEGSKCNTQLFLCTDKTDKPIKSNIKPTFNASQVATLQSYLDTLNSIVQPVVAKHVAQHKFFQSKVTDNDCDFDIRDERDKAIITARIKGAGHPYGGLSHWTRHGSAVSTSFDRGLYQYDYIDLGVDPPPTENEALIGPLSGEEIQERVAGWAQDIEEDASVTGQAG